MKQISLIRQKLAIAVAYFLIYVVWGSTYYFIGVALRDIPTFFAWCSALFTGRYPATDNLRLSWRKSDALGAPSAICCERHRSVVR